MLIFVKHFTLHMAKYFPFSFNINTKCRKRRLSMNISPINSVNFTKRNRNVEQHSRQERPMTWDEMQVQMEDSKKMRQQVKTGAKLSMALLSALGLGTLVVPTSCEKDLITVTTNITGDTSKTGGKGPSVDMHDTTWHYYDKDSIRWNVKDSTVTNMVVTTDTQHFRVPVITYDSITVPVRVPVITYDSINDSIRVPVVTYDSINDSVRVPVITYDSINDSVRVPVIHYYDSTYVKHDTTYVTDTLKSFIPNPIQAMNNSAIQDSLRKYAGILGFTVPTNEAIYGWEAHDRLNDELIQTKVTEVGYNETGEVKTLTLVKEVTSNPTSSSPNIKRYEVHMSVYPGVGVGVLTLNSNGTPNVNQSFFLMSGASDVNEFFDKWGTDHRMTLDPGPVVGTVHYEYRNSAGQLVNSSYDGASLITK
jgi:hypothetical protein